VAVQFDDDSALDESTFDNFDLVISGMAGWTGVSIGCKRWVSQTYLIGPGGASVPLVRTTTAVVVVGTGNIREVEYSTGSLQWQAAHTGTWTLNLNADQVGDFGSPKLFVPATNAIDTFTVTGKCHNPLVVSFVLTKQTQFWA
jgi:hypothetical protein